MCRARLRDVSNYDLQKINDIKDKELKRIAEMYFIEHMGQIDIAFELNYSEDTIYLRVREIKEMIKKK